MSDLLSFVYSKQFTPEEKKSAILSNPLTLEELWEDMIIVVLAGEILDIFKKEGKEQ